MGLGKKSGHNGNDFGQLGFALDQREQAAFVPGTDNGIALPVSQTSFARDNGRTLGNVDFIGDQTAYVFIPRWEKQGDGTWQATVVVVGRDGITPPM